MYKKIIATSVLLASLASFSTVNADSYKDKEISCTTDPVFSQNSCNQCFDGGVKGEKDTVGGLSDLWVNRSGVDEVMFKELNFGKGSEPKMVSLGGAEWIEDKISDNFWQPTKELEALYDDKTQGYLLKAGQSVNWIESTEGSSYVLNKNTAEKGTNIGLLVYDLKINKITETGEPLTDQDVHKECVLFKSGEKAKIPVNGGKKEQLPKTGPEHFILLLLLAMFLAFGVLRFKKG